MLKPPSEVNVACTQYGLDGRLPRHEQGNEGAGPWTDSDYQLV